ncbi:MAG: proton-conducting transporter membrane subunit [Spirochaetota bacterium]
MIALLIAIPVAAALIVPFLRKQAHIVFFAMTLLLAAVAAYVALHGFAVLNAMPPWPMFFTLTADKFSILMIVLIAIVALVTAFASLSFTNDYTYYALASLAIAGMNGIMLVNDIFTLYVFIEVASLATFALIAFNRNVEGFEAAFKYIILSTVATTFILLGIFILYGITGGVSFAEISVGVKRPESVKPGLFCLMLLAAGFLVKSGFVPFHTWVPDAYGASPNPISITLAGIITKAVGLYALIRIAVTVIGVTPAISMIMLVIGIITAVTGAVLAINQPDGKRMLAYSSISQMGYIVLGIFSGNPIGVVGGVFHLFNHAILKSLLFINMASLESSTKSRELEKYSGIGEKMPVTSGTFAVGSLSIAGIPPLNGFFSKLFILIGLFAAKQTAIGVLATLASVLTLWYFLVFQRKVIFGKASEAVASVREAPLTYIIPAVLLAAISIVTGIGFSPTISAFIAPAADVLMNAASDATSAGVLP